jgi:hypothetical protein
VQEEVRLLLRLHVARVALAQLLDLKCAVSRFLDPLCSLLLLRQQPPDAVLLREGTSAREGKEQHVRRDGRQGGA